MDDYQLSLAIGKEGQNVRLAAKLTGWKIDIKSKIDYVNKYQIEKESADNPDDILAELKEELELEERQSADDFELPEELDGLDDFEEIELADSEPAAEPELES